MADAWDGNQPAIRHRRDHLRKIGVRDPRVLFTPDDEVWMPDIRHAPRQLVAFPLEVEVERRPDPDSLRDAEGLLQVSFEERLDLTQAGTELRHGIRCQTLRNEQRGCGSRHHGARDVLARHHRAKQADLLVVEGQSERGYGIQRQYPSESLRLL